MIPAAIIKIGSKMTTRDEAAARFQGVMATPVTPFRDDYSLDVDAVESNAARLVGDGAAGLVVCGSIGELPTLTADEWEAVVARSIAAGGPAVPVFATVAHTDMRVVRRMVERAAELGVSGVVIVPPFYYAISDAEIYGFYREVDAGGVPFIVYNHPGTGRPEIGVSVLKEIAGLDHFAGLKEATENGVEYLAKRTLLKGRANILSAAESVLFFMAAAGTDGCLTAVSTFAPSFLKGLLAAFDAGDLKGARAINTRLMAFRDIVHHQAAEGRTAYLTVSKAAVEIAGLRAGPPRPPIAPLSAGARRQLAIVLRDELGITR